MVVVLSEGPLSDTICWLMLITHINSSMTTTRSSRTPSSPQREGSESNCMADDDDDDDDETVSRGGEEMDITVPTQHKTTLKKNSQTSPPMVPRPRAISCRRRDASHR